MLCSRIYRSSRPKNAQKFHVKFNTDLEVVFLQYKSTNNALCRMYLCFVRVIKRYFMTDLSR